MESSIENRRKAWNAYWVAGVVHSCIGKYVDTADSAIYRFWQEQFAILTENDRVLDLATGNGAVPKLLLSQNSNLQIDAVDLAEIAPGWFLPEKYKNLRFHTGVRAEELPFPDAVFSLVTSQFGLEYTNWPDAIHAAVRVCGPNGHLAFVLHHDDSVVIKLGKIELRHQQQLLGSGGLIEVAKTLLPKLVQIQAGVAPNKEAEIARDAYNQVLRKLTVQIQQSEAPDLLIEACEKVHSILSGRFGAEFVHRDALLQSYSQALSFAQLRTSELLACALDQKKLDELLKILHTLRPNSVVKCQLLQQQEEIVAWGVSVS